MTPAQMKKARKALEWTQFKLSEKTGISRYNIALIETGNRKIKPSEDKVLVRVLKGASK